MDLHPSSGPRSDVATNFVTPVMNGPTFFYGITSNPAAAAANSNPAAESAGNSNAGGGSSRTTRMSDDSTPCIGSSLTVQERAANIRKQM